MSFREYDQVATKQFGRLTVINLGDPLVSTDRSGRSRIRNRVRCRCECGVIKDFFLRDIVQGITVSCGCYSREQSKIRNRYRARTVCHDHSHPLRSVWWSMHVRCYNLKNSRWHRYGGRGIAVCQRWNVFENFLADMPDRPPGTSIDRIDNDGNYEPSNCRWATAKEQANNSTTARIIEFRGESLSITQLAEKYGLKPATLWARLKYGWSIEDAITKPLRRGKTL